MLTEQFLLFILLPICAFSVRPYTIEFVSYHDDYIPEFYQVLSFKLYKKSNHLVFNGSAIFAKDINDFNVTMRAIVTEKQRRKWKLVDITLDACSLIKGSKKKGFNLVKMVIKNIKAFGHMIPEQCPFKKGNEYYVRDYFTDVNHFPLTLFPMNVNISIDLSKAKQKFYRGNFVIVVKSNRV